MAMLRIRRDMEERLRNAAHVIVHPFLSLTCQKTEATHAIQPVDEHPDVQVDVHADPDHVQPIHETPEPQGVFVPQSAHGPLVLTTIPAPLYQNVARFRDQTDGMIHADVRSSSGVQLKLTLSGSSSILIPNRDEARANWICCPMEEIMGELRWSREIVRKTLERIPHESIRRHVAKVTFTKLEQQTRTCLSIAMVAWLEALHRDGAVHEWLLNSSEQVDRLFLGSSSLKRSCWLIAQVPSSIGRCRFTVVRTRSLRCELLHDGAVKLNRSRSRFGRFAPVPVVAELTMSKRPSKTPR